MPDRNLLDELMQLLNEPGPVNWALAAQLADHLSGPAEPIDPWLAEEYLELARFAQLQIPRATGIPVDPMIEVVPVDRIGWMRRNLRSFAYVVEPLAAKLASGSGAGPLDAVLKPLGPALLGMQMGAVVGSLSKSVLGLFDAGLPASHPAGITVLVPNIETFTAEYGLEDRQVRMWSILHEVVHHALLSRPWVHPHLAGIFDALIGSAELDISAMARWHEDLADPAKLEERMTQGGVLGLFGGPIEKDDLGPIESLISMLEGYGSYLVGRASEKMLPDLPSIRAAISSRRVNRIGESVLGGLFKVESTAGGEGPASAFCLEVSNRWGEAAVHRIWEGPENLPMPQELKDATEWAARVLLDDPFA